MLRQAILAAGDGVPDHESRRFVVTSVDQHAPVAAVKGLGGVVATASHRHRRCRCWWRETRGWDESRTHAPTGVVDVAQQGWCLVEPAEEAAAVTVGEEDAARGLTNESDTYEKSWLVRRNAEDRRSLRRAPPAAPPCRSRCLLVCLIRLLDPMQARRSAPHAGLRHQSSPHPNKKSEGGYWSRFRTRRRWQNNWT